MVSQCTKFEVSRWDEFYCVFTAEVSSLYSRSFSVRNAYYETMWPEKGYFVVDGHLPPGHTPPGQTPIKDLSDASVTIPASPAAYPPTGC